MPKDFKYFKWSGKKAVAFLVLTIVLATAVIGTTLAYVIAFANSLINTFEAPEVEVSVSGNQVQNKGDIAVYARVAVVAAVYDENGNMLPYTIAVTDGTPDVLAITVELNSGWFVGDDGFYYCASPLAVGGSSEPFDDITPVGTIDDTAYEIRVTVLNEVIQATPDEAVEAAWPAVDVVEGSLAKKTTSN